MQREIRRRGVKLGLGDDHVNVTEAAGRAVLQPPLINYRPEMRADATIAVCQGRGSAGEIGRRAALDEPELPLADVLLIADDLLMQAKSLVASGTRAEAIEAILDHVTALREGRS